MLKFSIIQWTRKINTITALIPSCIDIHVTKGSIKGYLHIGSTINRMPSAEPKKKQMDTQKQKDTHFARNFLNYFIIHLI